MVTDSVARKLNSIKGGYQPIYVCQYDLKYLRIHFTL